MKVREMMTRPAETCSADVDLATAAMMMWWKDCGALPVTEGRDGRVIGMITDRDICMATAIQHRSPDHVRVGEIVNGSLHAVGPDDSVDAAIERMAKARIRRVPVLNEAGKAVGVLSLNDLILHSEDARTRNPSPLHPGRLMRALKAIGAHRTEAVLAAQNAGS